MVLVATIGQPGLAAEDGVEQARAHVRKATAAYNLGRYTEAAKEYETAYEKTLDPNMLFNVGQAWRLAGERQKALTAYRSYLRSAPKGEQRSMAEAKIKELEEQRSDQRSAAPTSPPAEAAPAATTPVVGTLPAAAPAPVVTHVLPSLPPPATTVAQSESAPNEGAANSTGRSFYTRWPFWTAVGAVVAAGVVTGIILGYGKGDLSMPPTDYGVKRY